MSMIDEILANAEFRETMDNGYKALIALNDDEAATWELRRQWLAVQDDIKQQSGSYYGMTNEQIEFWRRRIEEHFRENGT